MSVQISATTFTKFCMASGQQRFTIVKNAKNQYRDVGYKQGGDFWKPLRDELPRALASDDPTVALKEFLETGHVPHDRYERYRSTVEALGGWIGRKQISVHATRAKHWAFAGLDVTVRPELAVMINSKPYVIKLWFDVNKRLAKEQADPLLQLLDDTHGKGANKTATPAVLDVVRGRLIKPTREVPGLEARLRAEAACFVHLWGELR